MQYDYTNRTKSIQHRVEKIMDKELNSIRYPLISSSLKRFIPMMMESEHLPFIQSVMINQALAWNEQTDVGLLSFCKTIKHTVLSNSPTIYCSFHMSSYRLNMLYLLSQNIPVTLVASEDVIQEQGEIIQKSCSMITTLPIQDIINANSQHSIFTMARELKEGRNLFIYVDGNTGVDGMSSNNKNLTQVQLLASQIMARTGIFHLSYITNTPITPIITTRKNGEFPLIEIFGQTQKKPNENRIEYTSRAIKEVYSILNDKLEQFAAQWEPWLYIYKFARREKQKNITENKQYVTTPMIFNHFRYKVFNYRNEYYLIDNMDFSMLEIDKEIFHVLKKEKISYSELSGNFLLDFVRNDVLITTAN